MFVPANSSKSRQQFTDQEVISRYVVDKSDRWVNELYRRYIHLIFGVCLKYTADRETSKEIAMQVFEKMLEQLPLHPIEEFHNFNAWLFVLIKNTCFSYLRKKRSDRNRKEQIMNLGNSEARFMENEGWLRLLNSEMIEEQPEQLTTLIREALKELNAKQRKCIRLFFFEKLSYKEIHKETKFELREIKSALQNGKRKLRIYLTNKLNPESR